MTKKKVHVEGAEATIDLGTHRIEGVAIQGDTPFSVPLISHIEGNLYTGGCLAGERLPQGIKFVCSLYPWESYKLHDEVKSVLSVPLYDFNEEMPEKVISQTAWWVITALEMGPTLVHCQAGLNRSALIAAYTLMLMGDNADEAIKKIRDARSEACLCNKTFENWLLELDQYV